MKIDRRFFERFEDKIKSDETIKSMVDEKDFESAEKYIYKHIFGKPKEFYDLNKLTDANKLDRKLTLREIIEKVFALIPYFKSKDELPEDEFEKFDSRYLPDEQTVLLRKELFQKLHHRQRIP